MRIVAVRDDFKCAVLEPAADGDLRVLFDAKYMLYNDRTNDDAGRHRKKILAAMDKEGLPYYEAMFLDPNNTHFILLNADHEIVGSSAVLTDAKQEVALFASSHINPDLRGQHLVDLFYQAREDHIRENSDCRTLKLTTLRYNAASQRAAERNGFARSQKYTRGNLIFEKTL